MHLIFRVDASTKTGTGHLMRCLALAQAWQSRKYECTFITHCTIDNILKKLEQFTRKRYNNNGEKLVLEILKKIEKNRGTSF